MPETAEFLDEPLIHVSCTSTLVLVALWGTLRGKNKGWQRGVWLNVALTIAVGAAFLNLSFRINRPLAQLPYLLYLRVWDASWRRACVLLFFLIQLGASLAYCVMQAERGGCASTTQRKFFHATISLIAFAGILYEPVFVRLSAYLMLQIFVILEILRSLKVAPWSDFLNTYLATFIDPNQESENLILTPILLIAGVFLPLFLSPVSFADAHPLRLHHFAGIATVGVGDSLAAIVGSRFGSTRLPPPFQKRKSVEGLLAMFVGQCVFYSFLISCGFVHATLVDFLRIVAAVITCTLLEAKLSYGDNIVLPFAAWFLLSLLA